MKLILYNGTTEYDVTDRVISAGSIHERFGDGDGFMVPGWDFELDNIDNWYSQIYKPTILANNETIYVQLTTGTTSLFTGYLKNTVPVLTGFQRSVCQFDCIHIMQTLAEHTVKSDPAKRVLDSVEQYFTTNGWRQKAAAFSTDLSVKLMRTWFQNEKDMLSLLGEYCQSMGAIPYWDNDQIFVKPINTMLDATPTEIMPLSIGNAEPVDKYGGILITGSYSGSEYSAWFNSDESIDRGRRVDENGRRASQRRSTVYTGVRAPEVANALTWDSNVFSHLFTSTNKHLVELGKDETIGMRSAQAWGRIHCANGTALPITIEQGWDIHPGEMVSFDNSSFFVLEATKKVAFEDKFTTELIVRSLE